MFVERSQVLGIITPPGMGDARANNFLRGRRARRHAFLGADPYGPASGGWAGMLSAGKLQPVADGFMGWGACKGGGCAFDPSDPGTLYLTKVTPFGGTPPAGYKIGPKPSAVSWSGSGPPPWPGTTPPPGTTVAPDGTVISSPTGSYTVPNGPNTFYPQPPSGGGYVNPNANAIGGQPFVPPQAPAQGISPLWIAAGIGGAALILLAILKRKRKAVFVSAPAPTVTAAQPAAPVAAH